MLIRATFIFYFCESRPVPPVPQYPVEMRKEDEIIVVEKRKKIRKRKKKKKGSLSNQRLMGQISTPPVVNSHESPPLACPGDHNTMQPLETNPKIPSVPSIPSQISRPICSNCCKQAHYSAADIPPWRNLCLFPPRPEQPKIKKNKAYLIYHARNS